jgi:4-nitrophenyl phosphatase
LTKGNPTHPRCFLIDVEGTIVLDKSLRPIPGAQEFIGKLVHGQRPYSLVTNFTTDTPADLASRLKSHGFQIQEQHIQSPLSTVIPILQRMNVQTVYTIGTPALKDYLINNGIQSHEEPTVDAVVVGLDTEVDYHKLKVACQAIVHHKAVLVGLHRGRIYDDEHGETAPSVGTIVAALEWATQEHAITVGKPSQAFFKLALEWLDASPGECVMISDDPFTDLAQSKRMGMKTCFVLTGKYTDPTVLDRLPATEQPDWVLDSIVDLASRAGID